MEKILTVENLYKSYRDVKAIKGSSFYVERGSLFALLGENGAGKSTTIDILATLLQPDSGKIMVDGLEIGKEDTKIRQKIGIVFQQNLLDHKLSVHENLLIRGSFYSLSRSDLNRKIEELSLALGLEEFLHRPYGKLSGGQKRRADIARALINTPDILFLDEPTSGLDPASRSAIWELVRSLQRTMGTTVLLTTHYMEEAANADYIIVMGHGEILAKGTPPTIKASYSHDSLRFEALDEQAMNDLLENNLIAFKKIGSEFIIPLTSTLTAIPFIEKYSDSFKHFQVVQGSLEEAFLHIINSQKGEYHDSAC